MHLVALAWRVRPVPRWPSWAAGARTAARRAGLEDVEEVLT
jgi:hypothetical protein